MTPRLKRLGLGLAAFVAVGLAALAGFLAFLHTGPGERWVSGKIEEVMADPDQRVELDGYHLLWPFRMRADYLRLMDRRGTWLEVAKPELYWHPDRLWRRVLDIDRLAAERVLVRRLPEAADGGQATLPEIRGTLHLEELHAPIVLEQPVLGERLELELGGTFRMQGGGGTVDLHLRSPGGDLVRIDGQAGRDFLDLRWYLRVPELGRWQRLAGVPLAGDATGSGFIAGRLPSPVVSGQVDVGPGRASDLGWRALSLTGSVTPEAGNWHTGLMAEAQSPHLNGRPAPVPVATLGLAGLVNPAAGRLSLGHLRLEAGVVAVTAAGILDQWGRQSTLRFRADIGDLAQLGGAPYKGRVRARGQVMGDLIAPALHGRAEARADGPGTGIAALDRLLGARAEAEAAFGYRDARLTLNEVTLNGERATLRAQGTIGSEIALWANLSVPDLSVLSAEVNGAGLVKARVHGAVSSPSAFGLARVGGLAVGGVPPGDGAVAFDLTDLAGRPRGNLSAELSVAGYPLDGRARVEMGEAVHVRDLVLVSGSSRVAGDLVVARGGVRGRLTGSIPELKAWERLVGRPISGRVEAEAVLDPEAGQSLRLGARGERLAGAGIVIGTVTVEADLAQLTTTPRGMIAVEAGAVAGQGGRLDRLSARLSGDGRAFRFDAEGAGAGARVEAEGAARLEGRAGQAEIRRLRLAWGEINAALARPARFDWSANGMALAPTALALGGGRVEVEGRLAGRAVTGRARLDAVPLGLIESLAPRLDAVGAVSGTVAVDGGLDDPRVRVELNGRNVGFAAAARAGIGRLTTRLVADWRSGRVQGEVSAGEGDKVRAEAAFAFPMPGEGPLSGSFDVSGDIARLTEALPLPGHVFAGRLDAEGRVAGTLNAPRLMGRANWTGGRYENLESGTIVTAITARAIVDGEQVEVTAEGGDGGRGTVRAEGAGSLDGTYRADIALGRFTLLRRDDVEGEVDGTVRLSGDGTRGRLEGRLSVPRAEIDIARIKGHEPVKLDVVEINRPGQQARDERERRRRREEAPVTVALGLEVAVDHAFVRGRGLDSEWQGQVGVGGTLSRPSLTGRLVAARGEFDFLGKQFRLSPESEVAFQGGDSIDPSLNVTAEARAEEITAQVQISGTAARPEVAITSQPVLPQDEVLARVLFGREAGKLSAFQQIQVAQMAASGLTPGGGGFDPIGDIRGFLGLDVLGVGAAEETRAPGRQSAGAGGPTVSAGKYIGRDTFVRVDQGTGGLGKVTVEQELGGGFSVESSVGEQGGGGLGFNWRKDY